MGIEDEIKTFLSAPRGGRTLDSGLVLAITLSLVEVAKVKDITTLEVIEVEDLAAEAWQHYNEGKSLPKFHLKKVKAWAKGKRARSVCLDLLVCFVVPPIHPGSCRGAASVLW